MIYFRERKPKKNWIILIQYYMRCNNIIIFSLTYYVKFSYTIITTVIKM